MHRLAVLVVASGLWLAPTSSQAAGLNGFLAGLNGILTAPADPVIELIEPPLDFDEVPGKPVTNRILGFVFGTLGGVQRVGWGALDIALTPLWIVPTLSPKARLEIIPFYEVEYEI